MTEILDRVEIGITTQPRTVADVAGHLFGIIDVDTATDISANKENLEGFGE